MCTKAHRREGLTPMAAGAYEGQTIRMSDADGASVEQRRACWGRGFPWWSLWLIWPLIGLLKWATPFYAGALATLHSAIGAPERPAALLAGALLIVAGLALIRRAS